MVRSFTLSSLARRFSSAAFDSFARDFPDPWLVWEPGHWSPDAGAGGPTQQRFLRTDASGAQVVADALAMVLQRVPGGRLSLGRVPECDLPINDATLSRCHMFLVPTLAGWSVLDAGSRHGTTVSGRRLGREELVPLRQGDAIEAGGVVLTFHDARGLFARLVPFRSR